MAKGKRPQPVSELRQITLENDNGATISFRGKLYAQTSFFEEETGVLTKQELYSTQEGDQAFRIISSNGEQKTKASYLIKRNEEACVITNGEKTLSLPFEWLFLFTDILSERDLEERQARHGQPTRNATVNE